MPKKQIAVVQLTNETYDLPVSMGEEAKIVFRRSGGGMGAMTRLITNALIKRDLRVDIITPDYKTIFLDHASAHHKMDYREYVRFKHSIDQRHIHLVSSVHFSRLRDIYEEPIQTAASFQELSRERVKQLDGRYRNRMILHGHDQYTGVIAAYARARGIPYVHSLHNIYTLLLNRKARPVQPGEPAQPSHFFHFDFEEYLPSAMDRVMDYLKETDMDSGVIDAHATAVANADLVLPVGEQFTLELIAGRFDDWPELASSLPTIEEVRVKDRFGQVWPIKNPIDPKDLPENQDHLEHSFSHLTLDVLEAKRLNRRAMQRQCGLTPDDDAIVVAWTSRLDQPQKGVEDFIDLIPYALGLNERVQIVVIGDAPRDQQRYEQQLRELMNIHRQRLYYQAFDQRRSDQLYAQADLVVGASRREPFGLFLTQAIAAGAVVTAPANGGTLDIVKPLDLQAGTGNGVIYNDPNREGLRWGLATSVRTLIEARTNRERWNRHVKQMMQDIRVEFSLDRYVDKLIAAYNRVAIERGLYEDGYVLL